MVGRVRPHDRKLMAETIVALHQKDKHKIHSLYQKNGYRATWARGKRDVLHDPNIVHRFATFHFDKFDLSPLTLTSDPASTIAKNDPKRGITSANHKTTIELMDLLQTTVEHSVPEWIEQGRRLSGLLAGVSIQAARPVSMAKEWYELAKEALVELDGVVHEERNHDDLSQQR